VGTIREFTPLALQLAGQTLSPNDGMATCATPLEWN
jgi:hypothetical protein